MIHVRSCDFDYFTSSGSLFFLTRGEVVINCRYLFVHLGASAIQWVSPFPFKVARISFRKPKQNLGIGIRSFL